MSTTLATVASPLADKLVTLVLSTSTEEDNVSGSSGKLYGIEIDYAPASTKQTYMIPAGAAFSVGFSAWATTTAANGTTQAFDGTGNITVTLLCD